DLPAPSDGGYGWVIVLAIFWNNAHHWGILSVSQQLLFCSTLQRASSNGDLELWCLHAMVPRPPRLRFRHVSRLRSHWWLSCVAILPYCTVGNHNPSYIRSQISYGARSLV